MRTKEHKPGSLVNYRHRNGPCCPATMRPVKLRPLGRGRGGDHRRVPALGIARRGDHRKRAFSATHAHGPWRLQHRAHALQRRAPQLPPCERSLPVHGAPQLQAAQLPGGAAGDGAEARRDPPDDRGRRGYRQDHRGPAHHPRADGAWGDQALRHPVPAAPVRPVGAGTARQAGHRSGCDPQRHRARPAEEGARRATPLPLLSLPGHQHRLHQEQS